MDTQIKVGSEPLVSIIIVCYNYGKYVRVAVETARAQTFRNLEIIVVDGGSDDRHTIEVLEGMKNTDLRVYTRLERHQVGDNRNFGIRLARGKYICCLDADDLIRPSYIEKAVILLQSLSVDIVSTSRREFGGQGRVSILKTRPQLSEILLENQMNTVSVFTKEIWTKAGGFEDFGLGEDHYHEDWHFWMKCMTVGARVHSIAYETLFLYRLHTDGSLSQQGGKVPKLSRQIQFIQKEHEKLLKKRTDTLENGQTEITVRQGALEELAENSLENDSVVLMILVPCFDLITVVGWLEAWVNALGWNFIRFVLVATENFEDREDMLGLKLDEISPLNYDYPRSFSSVDELEFLKYLVRSKYVSDLYVVDDAISPETAGILQNDCAGISVAAFSSIDIERDLESQNVLTEGEARGKVNPVKIVCEGDKNDRSSGSEVWLLAVRNSEGYIIRSDLFKKTPGRGWRIVDCGASPLGKALLATQHATIELEVPEHSTLQFLRHDWSGRVSVEYLDTNNTIDLYSEISGTKVLKL
jgi:glycosyltransferase involved in cell wall biosynthesis